MLQDEDGHNLMQQGSVPACNLNQLRAEGWSVDGYRYWAQTRYHDRPCRLGLSMGMDAVITDEEKRLLNSLIHTPLSAETEQGAYVKDVLQAENPAGTGRR